MLRRALGALVDGVVVSDTSGQIVFANRAAKRLLAGQSGLSDVVRDEIARVASNGRQHRVEWREPGEGLRRWDVVTERLTQHGELLGFVVVARDVTELHRSLTVRRDFVANVGHELRTPVGGILSLSDALVGEDDPATMRRLTERIRTEADRLAVLIDDLLDLTRLELNQEPDLLRPVALADVVAASLDRIAELANSAGVRVDCSNMQGVWICGSTRDLVPALTNLLDNAVKYSPDEGVVRICARVSNKWVDIDVIDEGVGIPDREKSRIFERFYRVDSARSRRTGGSGLGLAVVRHVAINHGGDVRVKSREGHGSTFTLRLRRAGDRA